MVSIGNLIEVPSEGKDVPLLEFVSNRDRAALEKLQLSYLLQFEEAALSKIYHNPKEKRVVDVPAGELRFAVRLSSTTVYFSIESDPEARWIFVNPFQLDYFYIARITTDSLLWTWFFFDRQLTGAPLEMYVFDAVVVSPVSLGAGIITGNTSVTTRVVTARELQGKTFKSAYETSSTITRALPSLIEEVVDFLMQSWYTMIAEAKRELLREVGKQMALANSLSERAVGKLSDLAELTVEVTQQGAELVFDFTAATSSFNFDSTIAEVRESERFNAELLAIFNALQEVDVQGTVGSVRGAAVAFFSEHSITTLVSVVTLAAGELTRRNPGVLTTSGKTFVTASWALVNTVFHFLRGRSFGNMGLVAQAWSYVKCNPRASATLAEMMSQLATNLPYSSSIVSHDLMVAPASPTVIVVKVVASLVALGYLYRNGYLEGVDEAATSTFREVVKVTYNIAIPIIPSGLVYYTSSLFLGSVPTTAFAATTLGFGLAYRMYQLSSKETQEQVDKQLEQALLESAKLVPKIPIAVGKVLDGAGAILVAGAAVYALSSFPGTFSLGGGTVVKRKGTKQFRKLKEKKEK